MHREERKLQKALPLLLLAAIVLFFFAPILFQGQTFFAFDNLRTYLPWSTGHPRFTPENPLITDPVNGLIYPTMSLLQNGLEQGQIALWNPYVLCGLPQTPQSNPLEYLTYGLFSVPVAHDLLLALYLFSSLVFTWLFLRALGLGRVPAIVGSIAWGFNPYVMVWFEFEHSPLQAATLPAMLFFIERWFRTRRVSSIVGLATAAAFSLWADYVQPTVYQWLLVGGWTAMRLWRLRAEASLAGLASPLIRTLRRDGLPLAVAFVVAAFLATNVITGGLYALAGAQRESVGFGELYRMTGALPREYLRTLVFPDFFGTPVGMVFPRLKAGPGYPANNYNELCIYAGIVPLLLAAASLAWVRRREVAFFAGCAALALLSAAGSLVYYPLYALFPGLDLASPTRILSIWGFGVAMLAALGLDALLGERGKRRWWALGAAGLVVIAAVAIVVEVQSASGLERVFRRAFSFEEHPWYFQELQSHIALAGRTLARPLALVGAGGVVLAGLIVARSKRARLVCGLALVALTIFDLVTFGARYNTTTPRSLAFPETPGIRFLLEDDSLFRVAGLGPFLHSGLLPFGIHDTGGYASFFPKRTGEMLFAADVPGIVSSSNQILFEPPEGEPGPAIHAFAGSPLLDLLNVKYLLVAPGQAPLQNPERPPTIQAPLELVHDDEIRIFRNPAAFPRAYFVRHYELVADRAAAYRALEEWSAADFRERVLLEAPPPEAFRDLSYRGKPGDAGAAPAPVRVLSYSLNEVELEVETAERGFVVLSDAWHPAWRATTNDRPASVLLANYALRAVPVEAGTSRIVLELRPRAVLAGMAITAGGWLLLAAAWVAVFVAGRRASKRIER